MLCAAVDPDGPLRAGGRKDRRESVAHQRDDQLGVGLLGLIAVLVVSPWGFMHKPVWTKIELYKCLLAAIAFAVWALMGWLAMKDSGRRWSLAALCPLGLALLVGFAIPDRVIDSKQPQFLVDIVSESLQPSRYVLTNNVGIAGGLAWELKRSDIIMFDKQGELKYGLDWPDAQGSFVSRAGFADWLAAHRQQGPVSLVLLMDKGRVCSTYRYRNRITPTSWAGSFSFSTCRNERLDLSGVRQPAELRRTALPETGDPPVPSRTAESPYTLLVGDGAVMSGRRHAAVAERPAVYSGQHRLSDAESEFRLGYPRGLGHLA